MGPNLCMYQAKPIIRTNSMCTTNHRYGLRDIQVGIALSSQLTWRFQGHDSDQTEYGQPWDMRLLGCRGSLLRDGQEPWYQPLAWLKYADHVAHPHAKNIIRKRSQEGFCMLKQWSRDMLYSRVDKDGFDARQKHSQQREAVRLCPWAKEVWISRKASGCSQAAKLKATRRDMLYSRVDKDGGNGIQREAEAVSDDKMILRDERELIWMTPWQGMQVIVIVSVKNLKKVIFGENLSWIKHRQFTSTSHASLLILTGMMSERPTDQPLACWSTLDVRSLGLYNMMISRTVVQCTRHEEDWRRHVHEEHKWCWWWHRREILSVAGSAKIPQPHAVHSLFELIKWVARGQQLIATDTDWHLVSARFFRGEIRWHSGPNKCAPWEYIPSGVCAVCNW